MTPTRTLRSSNSEKDFTAPSTSRARKVGAIPKTKTVKRPVKPTIKPHILPVITQSAIPDKKTFSRKSSIKVVYPPSQDSIKPREMATSIGGVEIDMSALNKDNQLLASTIITAVTAYLRQQFDEERSKYEARITNLESEIQTLKEKSESDKQSFRDKSDDLENYGRRNTIVLSGSFLPKVTPNENCIDISAKIIAENLGVNGFSRECIDVAHRLGKPRGDGDDKRSIIVKLCRRENKRRIFQACKIKKPVNLYINESISRTRSTIMYVLRKARQDFPNKFGICRTEDGNVKIMLPSPENPSRMMKETVNTRQALDVLLRTKINRTSQHFNARWEN